MSDVKLISPANGETVDLNAKYQKEFYECKNFRAVKRVIKKMNKLPEYRDKYTVPEPAKFKWQGSEDTYNLEISDNKDFENPVVVTTSETQAQVYNLKKCTKYYWRVNNCEPGFFITDNIVPRWLYIEGLTNLRDFGGDINNQGRQVKQGLVIRGPRLEDIKSEEAKAEMKSLIKTDLDLRAEAIDRLHLTESPLGKDIKFILYPYNGYHDVLVDEYSEKNKKLIDMFADESLYPIYFHCAGGQDRTGTLGFFLDAILGLEDKDIIRNYELTMQSNLDQKLSRSRKDKIKKFLKIIRKRNKHKSYAENTVDYLRECGVTDETMDKIREILLK